MDRQKQNLIDFAKLVAAGNTEFDRLEELAREILVDVEAPRTELETQFFNQAVSECSSDEVEIDADAAVSLSEAVDAENYKDGIAGAFVQAWVFVQAEELDFDPNAPSEELAAALSEDDENETDDEEAV